MSYLLEQWRHGASIAGSLIIGFPLMLALGCSDRFGESDDSSDADVQNGGDLDAGVPDDDEPGDGPLDGPLDDPLGNPLDDAAEADDHPGGSEGPPNQDAGNGDSEPGGVDSDDGAGGTGTDDAASGGDEGAVPSDDDSRADGVDPDSLSLPERYITSLADTRLVFEIDAVPGMLPRAQSESDLVARFSALLDKPDGVEVVHDDTLESRGDDYLWTDDDLFELAPDVFDDDAPPGTVSIHVMFLDGTYQSDSGGTVLGVAWRNRHIAMFTQTIDRSCNQVPLLGGLSDDACRASEFGVWSHEVGHVLGLVNAGLPMQAAHEDSEHPKHDAQEGCLMYWAYDGPSFVDTTVTRLGAGQQEIDFCEPSRADIRAVRERE